MKNNMYTIYDKKANFHSFPFRAQNNEVATRSLKNSFNDPNHQNTEYVKNPEDFILFKIGGFDDNTGEVLSSIEQVCELTSLLEDNDNEE